MNEALEELSDNIYALLITNMRIYDVLMALLGETNKEASNYVYEAHEAGHLLGSLPKLDLEDE